MKKYDIVIIGAGPAGLTMAQCCSKVSKNILVIDKEPVIGGCHRVKRINGMFSEHSPRIYLKNYVNFFSLLSEMNLDRDNLFTDYISGTNKLFSLFSTYELFVLFSAYSIFLFNDNYGKNISIYKYCSDNNYSNTGLDIIDRLCRVIDGADSKRFSLNKLFKTLDSSFGILQPKEPLDTLLFNKWQKYLEDFNVEFALNTNITDIIYDNDLNKIKYMVLNNNIKIYSNKYILAIPPVAITKLLKKYPDIKDAFGTFKDFDEWTEKTEYIEYVSMTYHFKEIQDIKPMNGVTFDTDYGVVVINLSDYMKNIEENYKQVLSVTLTICDKPSKYTNKSVNQSNEKELIKETFRQIKNSLYPNISDDYVAILNPNNYYYNNRWECSDEAYFNTVNTSYIPYESLIIKNLYNVGTQNGNSYIDYTTIESAVTNAIVLSKKLFPSLKYKYIIKNYLKLKDIILSIIILIFLIIIIYELCKK